MQCQLCQRVARALHPSSGYRIPKFYDSQDRRLVRLGSWQELQENQNCSTCLRIATLFNSEFELNACDPNVAEYSFWLFDFSSTHLFLRLESPSHNVWPSFTIDPLLEGSSERIGARAGLSWTEIGWTLNE